MLILAERTKLLPVSSIQAKPRWQLDPSLVLYLPLWNISGDVFLSQDAYGHTVTRYGATPTGQGGMSFDGADDYLSVPLGPSLALKTPFTLVAWGWSDNWALPNEVHNIIRTEYLLRVSGGGTLGLAYNDGAAWQAIWGGTFVVPTNSWNLIVGTWDGRTLRMWLNGVQDPTTASATTTPDVINAVTVGAGGGGGGERWRGRLGEVAVYNRALSEHEILNIYDETKGRYGGGA